MTTKLPEPMDVDTDIPDGLIPDGHYPFEVTDTEVCTTKAGDGTYIKLTADGVKGSPAEGMRIWQNYNYTNPNPTAVRIGRRDWQKLCRAVGLGGTVSDTSLLHGRRFVGEVYTEKGTGGYSDKNQFSDYQSINSAGATGAPPPPQPQQQQYQPPAPPAQAPQQPAHGFPDPNQQQQYQQPPAQQQMPPTNPPPQYQPQQPPAQAPQQQQQHQPQPGQPPAQQPQAPPPWKG